MSDLINAKCNDSILAEMVPESIIISDPTV